MFRSMARHAMLSLTVLAAVALCVSASATPASAGWYVAKSELTGTAALASTASVAEHFKLTSSGTTVECASSTLSNTGGELKNPNTLAATSITFNECKAAGTICKLAGSSIATVGLLGEVAEQAYPEAKATFKPKTGTTFATLKFEGTECSISGVKPLTGKFTAAMPTAQEEQVSQKVKVNPEKELKLGSNAAELLGSAEFKLASSSKWALNKPAPPAPKIETVNFLNNQPVYVDHIKGVFPEKKVGIEEFEKIGNNIEWEAPKGGAIKKNWPLAFIKETKICLEAQLALEEATAVFLEKKIEGEVTVTGETTIKGVNITFTKNLTKKAVEEQMEKHKTYLETGPIETTTALPDEVFYELATIKWKMKAKETGRANAFVLSAGETKHNVYTLLEKPTSTIFLTLLDLDTLGIEEGAQPPTSEIAIRRAWREYSAEEAEVPIVRIRTYKPATVTGELNRSGTPLTYYNKLAPGKTYKEINETAGVYTCSSSAAEALLEEGQGNCYAWARLFKAALAIEGIASEEVVIGAKFGAVGEPCAVLEACEFLVANWDFGAGNMERFPFSSSEVVDEEGLAGENDTNPPPYFIRHVLLKAGAALYDPSYAAGPFYGEEGLGMGEKPTETSVLKEYQHASIAGFCEPGAAGRCKRASAALEIAATAPFTP